jgi:hypothetical protein
MSTGESGQVCGLCQNNAVCVPCQDIDDTLPDVCVDEIYDNDYICQCSCDTSGQWCEQVMASPCALHQYVCLNDGVCVFNRSVCAVSCACRAGFDGEHCQRIVAGSDCHTTTSACPDGRVCEDLDGSINNQYTCLRPWTSSDFAATVVRDGVQGISVSANNGTSAYAALLTAITALCARATLFGWGLPIAPCLQHMAPHLQILLRLTSFVQERQPVLLMNGNRAVCTRHAIVELRTVVDDDGDEEACHWLLRLDLLPIVQSPIVAYLSQTLLPDKSRRSSVVYLSTSERVLVTWPAPFAWLLHPNAQSPNAHTHHMATRWTGKQRSAEVLLATSSGTEIRGMSSALPSAWNQEFAATSTWTFVPPSDLNGYLQCVHNATRHWDVGECV